MNKSKATQPPVVPAQGAVKQTTSWKNRLSQQDYQELKATFDLFDEDGGGTIDPVEVEKILEELGLKGRSSVVLEMVNALKEVNKPIKFDDFLNIICSKVGDVKSREGINRIFQIWDQNNNGFIYFKSFKRIARQLGETLNNEELTELMHNSYIMNNTQSHDSFSTQEFYNIVTKTMICQFLIVLDIIIKFSINTIFFNINFLQVLKSSENSDRRIKPLINVILSLVHLVQIPENYNIIILQIRNRKLQHGKLSQFTTYKMYRL